MSDTAGEQSLETVPGVAREEWQYELRSAQPLDRAAPTQANDSNRPASSAQNDTECSPQQQHLQQSKTTQMPIFYLD